MAVRLMTLTLQVDETDVRELVVPATKIYTSDFTKDLNVQPLPLQEPQNVININVVGTWRIHTITFFVTDRDITHTYFNELSGGDSTPVRINSILGFRKYMDQKFEDAYKVNRRYKLDTAPNDPNNETFYGQIRNIIMSQEIVGRMMCKITFAEGTISPDISVE